MSNDNEERELEFIVNLVPWSRFLNEQTRLKAFYIKRMKFRGLYPSVAIATLAIKSEFGNNPVSQEVFRGRPSNNLALLHVDEVWEGDKTKYLNINYKMFETYQDFFIHWSDLLVFRSPLLEVSDYDDQINLFSEVGYNEQIRSLIKKFNLTEHDYGLETEIRYGPKN